MGDGHASRTQRWKQQPWLVVTLALGLALAFLVPASVSAADGSLPGGTSLSVDIDEPADGLTIEVDDPAETVDLTVTGSASLAGADATKNTTLIYVLDLSGSMGFSWSTTDCTGDGNEELYLECQALAVEFLNDLAADPSSPVGWTGVATYSSANNLRTDAHNADLDPGRDDDRLLVPPEYDGDGNGVADLVDVVKGFDSGGGTNFEAGLWEALRILDESTTPVNRLVFISDGQAGSGDSTNLSGEFDGFGTTRIDTFAITEGSGCDAGSDPLEEVALLGSEPGTCTEVEDLSDLNFVLGQVLSSELLSLEGSVNSSDAQTIDDVTPDLPAQGPVTADFSWDVSDLGVGQHELCVTATGADGGGEGSVTECVTVTVEVPPAPDALTLSPSSATGTVGEEHTVTATLLDDDGEPISGAEVVFEITDGPHAGTTATITTDDEGEATSTYEGTEVGTDEIVATHQPEEGDELTSNTVTMEWSEVLGEVEELEDEAEPATPVEAEPDFTG